MKGPASRRVILCGLATLPTLTVPAVAVPVPSDLARACDWAVQHSIWINDPSHPDKEWPDERLHAEVAKVTAVYDIAIATPSTGLPDIKAKCRLLLDEYEKLVGDGVEEQDILLAVTIMREVIAL